MSWCFERGIRTTLFVNRIGMNVCATLSLWPQAANGVKRKMLALLIFPTSILAKNYRTSLRVVTEKIEKRSKYTVKDLTQVCLFCFSVFSVYVSFHVDVQNLENQFWDRAILKNGNKHKLSGSPDWSHVRFLELVSTVLSTSFPYIFGKTFWVSACSFNSYLIFQTRNLKKTRNVWFRPINFETQNSLSKQSLGPQLLCSYPEMPLTTVGKKNQLSFLVFIVIIIHSVRKQNE